MTKLAPSLINSAMPAASAGELPPAPTSLPPALILGMTWRMSCRTAARTGIAHALSQVTRGDVQHVDPGHGQDRVQIVHRCGLFNHGNHQELGVNPARRLVP